MEAISFNKSFRYNAHKQNIFIFIFREMSRREHVRTIPYVAYAIVYPNSSYGHIQLAIYHNPSYVEPGTSSAAYFCTLLQDLKA